MSRRAAAILLAIALIVALPSTASSATSSGKPAAETAAQKKPKKAKRHKRKKKKGKKNKTPIKLWYRIAIEGQGSKEDQPVDKSGLRQTTSTWTAPSRSAVILSREPASTAPGARPQFQYRFKAGFAGETSEATYTEMAFSKIPNCPGHTSITTQTTPGWFKGEVSGLIGPSAWVQLWARGLGGRGTRWTNDGGMCHNVESTQSVYAAPPVVVCADDTRWTVSGTVVWGGAFTVTATCVSHQVGNWGDTTDIESSVRMSFTPCPGRGTRVQEC
jgi:hypothetical protein